VIRAIARARRAQQVKPEPRTRPNPFPKGFGEPIAIDDDIEP
jgi:hypothetical protein